MECRPNFAYGSCNCLLCLYQQQIVFTIWVQLEISQNCNKRRPSLSTCILSFDCSYATGALWYIHAPWHCDRKFLSLELEKDLLELTSSTNYILLRRGFFHRIISILFSLPFFPRHFSGLCHQRSFGNEDELVWWLIDFRSSFSRFRPRGKISGEYYFDYTASVAYNAIIFRSLTIIVTKFSTTLMVCPGRPIGFRVCCQIMNLRKYHRWYVFDPLKLDSI